MTRWRAIADVQLFAWDGLPTALTVVDCSVIGNLAAGGAGDTGGNGQGGGVWVGPEAAATLHDSLLIANRADGGAAVGPAGLGQGAASTWTRWPRRAST